MKQTKMAKTVLIFLTMIPVVLFTIGLTLTFVLNARTQKLDSAKTEYAKSEEELKKQSEIYEYMSSDEYLEDYYTHHDHNGEAYGNEGDINIELKN